LGGAFRCGTHEVKIPTLREEDSGGTSYPSRSCESGGVSAVPPGLSSSCGALPRTYVLGYLMPPLRGCCEIRASLAEFSKARSVERGLFVAARTKSKSPTPSTTLRAGFNVIKGATLGREPGGRVSRPQGLKPISLRALTARLKPCPSTNRRADRRSRAVPGPLW
jgi:hypothetical protein